MNSVKCCYEWEARNLETFLKKLGIKCWSSPDDYKSTISIYTVTYDDNPLYLMAKMDKVKRKE
jgi:hypothetical protein